MNIESKCYFDIDHPFNPSYKEMLIIETDNWASCEIVNENTHYEVESTIRYECRNNEQLEIKHLEAKKINGIPLKNLWMEMYSREEWRLL